MCPPATAGAGESIRRAVRYKRMTDLRPFRVQARHLDPHHARTVIEASFEAAAVAYAEALPFAPGLEGELNVIVQDARTGHAHCFRLDLDTGEAAPCG